MVHTAFTVLKLGRVIPGSVYHDTMYTLYSILLFVYRSNFKSNDKALHFYADLKWNEIHLDI